MRDPRVDTGSVRLAAKFAERRDAHLGVHALEFGMNDQQRSAGIALNAKDRPLKQGGDVCVPIRPSEIAQLRP